jgi:tetratricopeptide (TPR) repeat protein
MKNIIAILLILAVGLLPLAAQDRVTKGKELLLQGKTNEALASFRRAVDINPRDTNALTWLGKAYLAANLPDSADIVAQNLISANGKLADGYSISAQALCALKKPMDAYTILRKGLKETKNNPNLLIQLGFVHLANDSTNQAVVIFSQAKEANANNPRLYAGLGEAYIKMGTEAMGMMQFEKSLELDSTQIDLRYKLANMYLKERRYIEAGKMYQSVLRLQPDNENAALELGKLYYIAKMWPSAAKALELYLKNHANDKEVYLMEVESLANSRQHENALAAAKHVLTMDPKASKALGVAARSLYFLRKHEESNQYYQKYAQLDTLTTDDFKRIGRNYLILKNDSLATLNWEQVLQREPNQPDLYTDMANSYMRMKKWDRASDMYAKKLAGDSTYVPGYINYALCRQQIKDFPSAYSALRKALTMRPNYVQGHYYMAVVLTQMDSVKAARGEFETVVVLADSVKEKFKNEFTRAHKYIATSYLQDKNFDKALPALEKYIELEPNDVEYRLFLAQTYFAKNRKDEAKREFLRVQKQDPKNKDAQNGLDRLEMYN